MGCDTCSQHTAQMCPALGSGSHPFHLSVCIRASSSQGDKPLSVPKRMTLVPKTQQFPGKSQTSLACKDTALSSHSTHISPFKMQKQKRATRKIMKELPKYQFSLFFHLLLFRPLGPGDQAVHPTRCVLVAQQLLAVLHQTRETNIKNISSLKFRSFPAASESGQH